MHRKHRFGQRFAQRRSPLLKSIWLIGMGILLLTQHVWPGILILIGISIVFSAMRTPKNNEFPEESSYYPSQPEPVAFNPAENLGPASNALPPQSLKPAPVVDAKPAFTGELPANCPRCGAPLKSDDIKWNGKQAACSYEIIPARVGLRLEYNNFQKITTARIFYGTDPLTSHG